MYRKNEFSNGNYMSSYNLKFKMDDTKFRRSPVNIDIAKKKSYEKDILHKAIEYKTRFAPRRINYLNSSSSKNDFRPMPDQRSPRTKQETIAGNSPRHEQYLLNINLQTNNHRHHLKYKFTELTQFKELNQYLKQIVGQRHVLFKTNNMVVDYLLTIPTEKVMVLRNYTLNLRADIHKKQIYPQNSLKRFNIIKCIGSGGFSKVFFAEVYGVYIALKVINKQFLLENNKQIIVQNQRKILLSLDHPFITKVHYTIQTQRYISIGMEYCNGGELFFLLKKVKRMRESQAKFYFLEVLAALKALHDKNIVYRDLKPQNIILDFEGHIRLADYGLSKFMDEDLTYSFCGSAEYMAPEMLSKNGHTFTVDYYCIGALLYELVTGLPPYYSRDHDQLFNNIMTAKLEFPDRVELSEEIKSLLVGLLQKNPTKRLGSNQGVNQILTHPWLNGISIQDVINKRLVPPFKPDPLEYNFDDSEYKMQEADEIKELQKQKEFGDLKLPLFRKFYYESKQMKLKRLELSNLQAYIKTEPEHSQSKRQLIKAKSPFNVNQRLRIEEKSRISSIPQKETPKFLNYQSAVQEKNILRKYDSTPNLDIRYSLQKKRYMPVQQNSYSNLKKPTLSQEGASMDRSGRKWNISSNINNSYNSKQKLQRRYEYNKESKKYLSQNYNINNLEFMKPRVHNQKIQLKRGYMNKDKYKTLFNK